ncbi:MAG TPA: hypothetical protein VGP85_15545 [Pyrinomonadaceae bacterium]|nr:hypothetical protein [Pyrinomonadaceae bacterium]
MAIKIIMVNLYGRLRIARANLSVSRSGTFGGGCGDVDAPQTPQAGSPAPTIAPQLRQRVGRPAVFGFEELSDNTQRLTSVMLNVQSITLTKFSCTYATMSDEL